MARALKVCSKPGCPTLTPGGRCTPHQREADRARGTSSQRGYDAAWERNRAAYLADPQHRLCAIRGPKCTVLATVPDHHPVSRRDLIAQGVRDPDAWHRLRPACAPCHGTATAEHQPGGWNAR